MAVVIQSVDKIVGREVHLCDVIIDSAKGLRDLKYGLG